MKDFHWPTAAQFGFSIFGLVNLWGLAFGVLVLVLVQTATGTPLASALQPGLIAAGMAGIGCVLVPSAGYSFLRLIGRPTTRGLPLPAWSRPSLLILAWPLVLGAGYLVGRVDFLAIWMLPVLHVLAVGLPVSWLVFLAMRDLPAGSPQRMWGVFASGAVLAPFLAFLFEIFLLLGVVLAWSVWLATQPELLSEMGALAEQIQRLGPDPVMLQQVLEPYLNSPGVWVGVLAYTSLLVPLLEELIKPVGVWFFARRGLSPAEGWAAGVLSGAGFAFAESLMLAGRTEDWTFLVFARVGTGVVHTLTTGMVGWGLASAWGGGRYLRLAGAYLGAVAIHALWNGLTIASTASDLAGQGMGFLPDWALKLTRSFPTVLGLLGCAGLLALLATNAYFIRTSQKVKNGVD